MESIHVALPEEIALEGLDGITLDALWFRLSERLKLPLPLNTNFQNEVWKIILSRKCYEYFVIEEDRPTPKRMDRREFYFDTNISDEDMTAYMNSTYYIYSYCPVDDPEIRGSCKEFKTREKLVSSEVKLLSLDDIRIKYNQKFVIVAIQDLRSSMLIPRNIGREVDINNVTYCILERIGRARYFGEATSGKFSLNDFVKDSKLLHYFRNTLLQNQLVVRQYLQTRVRGQPISGQLFHLPRFIVIVRASSALMVEKLFNFLNDKPNRSAESEEVRKHMDMKPKALIQLIKPRPNIFKLEHKVPYRQCYPNATKEEYSHKNSNEKRINAVTLVDSNMDVAELWNKQDEAPQVEDSGFLDISRQLLNRPLLQQVYRKIDETGQEGMSQHEIGVEFGLTKLNARSVLRKIQKQHNISFYMKDEGRQRVSKYITKKAATQANQILVDEMTKLLQKADEAATNAPTIENSPTKVSIPLPSSTLKALLPVDFEKKNILPHMMPKEMETSDGSIRDPDAEDDFKKVSVFVPSEESSFIDNVEDVTVSMRFLNRINDVNKGCKPISQASSDNLSAKKLKRMNFILDVLKTRTVIDMLTLLSEMRNSEKGKKEQICRKTMISLCNELHADNFLKIVELELKSATKTEKPVTSMYFAEPNVSFDMRCWHSIIEEQKIQHFITNNRVQEKRVIELKTSSSSATVPKISIESEELGAQSKQIDDFPKFMKLKLFHEFLFYLIYAYPEDHKKIPIANAIDIWSKENPSILEHDEITEKITNCYSSEISWKMFVPPLNPQKDYEHGWGLIRDILHRIPLILFVKFTRACQGTNELQKFLNHPIKCNYLLHFLPSQLRVNLLQGRKHVFIIQELLKRLCYCGLLQFGPSRTKEIDQSFIFLNRNASLLDTRSSDDGYLEVSDKDYPEIRFVFETPEEVSEYWNQMFQISMNTRINKRNTAIGKVVELEPSSVKPGLQLALTVQSPTSAPLNDKGIIPGDHKGAAGLDKSLMAHLKRNWTRQLENSKKKTSSSTTKTSTKSTFRSVKSSGKRDKPAIVKEAAAKIKQKAVKTKQNINNLSNNSKIIRRKVSSSLVKKQGLKSYDVVDKEALKLMKTMRVTWTEIEDKTLILTRVAIKFAFPLEAQSSYYISQSVYRDILHWRTDHALNKTTRSCARRIQYLSKMKTAIKEQIALYVEELRANREFNTKYRNLAERCKKIYPPEEIYNVIKIHIVEIVYRLHQMFYKQFLSTELESIEEVMPELPSNYDELSRHYTISNPAVSLIENLYLEPSTPKEAEISMIMSLVHGGVCSNKESRKQQIEVFTKFPDSHLSAAIVQLKRKNIISIDKKNKHKDKIYLPSSFPQFHLSMRYTVQMINVYAPFELYDEYLQAIQTISASKGSYQMENLNCGWIFMLAEMMCSEKISLSYEKADKLVMVDPSLRKKSTFDKISDNYLKLKKQDNSTGLKLKKIVKFSLDEPCDETFVFNEDPIELFFKLRNVYLHTFCILHAMSEGDVHVKSWKMLEDGDCSLDNCVVKSDDFGDKIQEIAIKEVKNVTEILNSSSLSSTSDVITKENFLSFYDDVIQENLTECDSSNQKDFSARAKTMWNKLSTRKLLESIVRLGTEKPHQEDSWLNEYKKIFGKNDDDGIEDESIDNIKHSTMFQRLKALNVDQKTSDAFVVNLSTIFVNHDYKEDGKTLFDGKEYNEDILPFKDEERDRFVQQIQNETLYTQEDLEVKDIFKELEKAGITGPLEIMQISEICSFVQSKSQSGAKSKELLEVFMDKHRLQKQMKILIKLKFIFRVGVVESSFVHKDFATFWLIESYFVTRSAARSQTEENNEEGPASKKVRLSDEAGPSTKRVDKYDKIRTLIRFRPSPWTRINGSVNKKVLEKWLGTILNHLSINPSVMLTDLFSKFNILTPFHIRDLCEILQMIGCAELSTIDEPEPDLFSDYTQSTIDTATMFCESEKIFVKHSDDAKLRLAFFIGHKKH